MSKRNRRPAPEKVTWEGACQLLEAALKGTTRREILDRALKGTDLDRATARLRAGMRAHVFGTAAGELALDGIVRTFDLRTRQEGFHVLLEWDHAAHRFLDEDIPVLMLDYFAGLDTAGRSPRESLAILLDYYFLYVLALFVMRVWDEGDPNRNLDRVTSLLRHLHGPQGSGQPFVEDAAALLFIAISHYEPDDLAYHRLLRKVRTLDDAHQTHLAMITAPLFGSHLRWGFPALYERDLTRMRGDNFSDYPWLFWSVATLMRGYARMREEGVGRAERDGVTGALLNGLTPDPWAFTGKAPESLSEYRTEHAEFQVLFERFREDLLEEFEAHRPSTGAYSPIGFHFNFPHNALIAMVVIGLLGESVPKLPLEALFAREAPGESAADSPEVLARRVTEYALANPERRGGRRVLMIAYDANIALRSFLRTMGALRKETGRGPRAAPADGGLQPLEGTPA